MALIAKLYERRWEIDAVELLKARMKSGLNQGEFADLCGWSQPYYCKMEMGRYKTVSEDTVFLLIETFQSLGIELEWEN